MKKIFVHRVSSNNANSISMIVRNFTTKGSFNKELGFGSRNQVSGGTFGLLIPTAEDGKTSISAASPEGQQILALEEDSELNNVVITDLEVTREDGTPIPNLYWAKVVE